jgi:hypothetical protein
MTFAITAVTLHDGAERHFIVESDRIEVAVQNLLVALTRKGITNHVEILEVKVDEE